MLAAMSDVLLPLLQCPACRKGAPRLAPALTPPARGSGVAADAAASGHECPACGQRFPTIDGIPWLFPDPASMLAEWRNRTSLYLHEFALEARRAREDLAHLVPGSTAHRRVSALAGAYARHAEQVRELMLPLGVRDGAMAHGTQVAFDTPLPATQDLHSYHANVHRDWAWGDAENVASYEALAPALAGVRGPVLVLGAGAGRLTYDVHRRGTHAPTVALDLNPLLLAVGRRVARGETLRLHEFPLAPLDAAAFAVERQLAAPAPCREGLVFVAADAWRAPFAAQAFDTVLTPWLLDIVDVEVEEVAMHVNRLLAPGGRWINFGSLAFPSRRPARRLSREEVRELVAAAGFEVTAEADHRLPYLQSPASRHARVETVASFVAEKRRRAPSPAGSGRRLPWLADTRLPVPRTADLELAATAARIRAVLLALLDGTRSVDDVVRIVAEQGLLSEAEARVATCRLLQRLHDDARPNGTASG
jgi:ubiquinone/menaquinone biosynthesis C-methylase UbiE/uncharacterized protein YbaR (Trm112 family)